MMHTKSLPVWFLIEHDDFDDTYTVEAVEHGRRKGGDEAMVFCFDHEDTARLFINSFYDNPFAAMAAYHIMQEMSLLAIDRQLADKGLFNTGALTL